MGEPTSGEEARAYVEGNADLARALGLASDAELTVEPLAAGEHNANFRLTAAGRLFVLRLNYASQLGLADQIGYEYGALRALAPSGRVPTALFVDSAGTAAGHGVLVESFVEGAWLDCADPAQVREAARVLADVHSTPVAPACPLLRPRDPLAAQLAACEGLFAAYEASDRAAPVVVARMRRLVERARAAVAAAPEPGADAGRILNTEAVPSHFLIGPDGRGTMVDWEKPVIGEPAQDVAYFLSPTSTIWDTDVIFDGQTRARFVADYWEAVDGRFPRGSFDGRLPAYVMVNALLGVVWSCNALVEYDDPARPLKSDKTRAKLPIYISDDFLDLLERDCFARG